MSSPEHRAGASSSFAGMRAIASSRRVLWAAALAVVVLALALAAYLYDHSRRDLIASGVRIDGIDVGGMREAGARVKLERTLATKLGYLLARQAFRTLNEKMDPRKVNGGVFLGLNGIVIKSHGGTDAEGFASAVDLGYDMARYDLLAKIEQTLGRSGAGDSAIRIGEVAS